MYKELAFELTGGRPQGTHTRFFYDRGMTVRMRLVHATPDSSWENIHAMGAPQDVAALRDLLAHGREPAMQDVEVVASTPRSVQYVVKWARRPSPGAGVPLDVLLHETAGPAAIYTMTMQNRRIQVTVAGPCGDDLLAFFTRVRDRLAERFDVRLVRVGDLSRTLDEEDAAGALAGLRAEDRHLLELALQNGYYDNPKRCGVRDLGHALGCSKSVVARKLRTLERQALESLLRPRAPEPAVPPAAVAPEGALAFGESPPTAPG